MSSRLADTDKNWTHNGMSQSLCCTALHCTALQEYSGFRQLNPISAHMQDPAQLTDEVPSFIDNIQGIP
jgi:hypothetical protein